MAAHTTSRTEIVDITKAWIAISIAFAIVLTGLSFSVQFLVGVAVAALTVGVGFLAHELAHKVVAQRYGCFAEFRANYSMLIIAVLMSFFGFVFAAPGAVMIAGGHIDFKRNGKISLTGPLINLILSVIFLGLFFMHPNIIFGYGFIINAWLGMFNMIPFGFFDGRKIFMWNKAVYIITAVAAVFLVFIGSSGILAGILQQ